jgi:cell division protein FtsA
MNKNNIVYIEMGGSHISAIAGYVEDNHALKILGEQKRLSDDIKSGVIEKISGAAFKINGTIKLLQNSLKLQPIKVASISVNARSMKNFNFSLENKVNSIVTDKLLNELKSRCIKNVETDKVHVFQCIPLNYYINGKNVENPLGIHASQIEVEYNLIVGNELVMESIERCFERTGIAVDYIHLGMEAIATAILDEEEKNDGCAVISFGATTTSLGIYLNGKLQDYLVIPLGGTNITKDIQELGISFENAETLKCKVGHAMEKFVRKPANIEVPAENPSMGKIKVSTQFLSTIIEARLEEMLEPLFQQLNSIPYPLHSGIVITGGGSKLKNIMDFIEEKTGLKVRMGSHEDWLSEDTDEHFFEPEYAEAVGSLLLTNELINQEKEIKAAIESKIPSKFLSKIKDKINNGMESLFKYDDLETNQKNDQN